jgi:TRAP-type C4-dicarboxylate transport system substrate-binding protein
MSRTVARLFATAVLAATVAVPVSAQEPIKLRVAGNLLATGLIQKNKEQPFFENLAKHTGLPLEVDYKPMDVVGVKDADGLRVLKSGLFDIMTLRIAQVSRDEPFLLGADLVGLNPDYEVARKVVSSYRDAMDRRLQDRHAAKLLAVWPFGPQVVFCRVAITGLADLKGKKVRVYDQSLAKFIESMGGIPVTIPFGETQQALERGVTDCAITGPSSANSAGWPDVTTHFMPIGFQIALNGYAMRLSRWTALTPDQQAKVTKAFNGLEDDIWAYSKELFDDAVRCNVGKEPCKTVKKYGMTEVPVRPGDQQMIREALAKVSFPTWSEVCEKSYPGCSAAWKKQLGDISGIK